MKSGKWTRLSELYKSLIHSIYSINPDESLMERNELKRCNMVDRTYSRHQEPKRYQLLALFADHAAGFGGLYHIVIRHSISQNLSVNQLKYLRFENVL